MFGCKDRGEELNKLLCYIGYCYRVVISLCSSIVIVVLIWSINDDDFILTSQTCLKAISWLTLNKRVHKHVGLRRNGSSFFIFTVQIPMENSLLNVGKEDLLIPEQCEVHLPFLLSW